MKNTLLLQSLLLSLAMMFGCDEETSDMPPFRMTERDAQINDGLADGSMPSDGPDAVLSFDRSMARAEDVSMNDVGAASEDSDASMESQFRSRKCEVKFTYRGSGSQVRLAGEWDWDNPEPMVPIDGVWQLNKDLSDLGSGPLCYKLVVDGQWRLDPANPYQAYCDGVQNSGVRVPDCQRPELSIDGSTTTSADGFSARVMFTAGAGASAEQGQPQSVTATLLHAFQETPIDAIWRPEDWSLQIELSDLAPGKYTVRVDAVDDTGLTAENLLLPFWIEAESFSWEDAVLYMVMTDRFVNGEPANDQAGSTGVVSSGDWEGGDLNGLAAQIRSGYFNDLGIRALWLNPVNTGADGMWIASDGVHQVTGFHGYWPIKPREVDPRVGGEAALREVVTAAHEKGIRVLMDFVINHVHEDHTYYQEHPEWFNDGCVCGSTGCDWTEQRLTCLFADYMPDVDWKNKAASEQFIQDALWWMETFDLDGARVDAVKHVDDLAIFNLVARVNERFETAGTDYYLDGETAMGWSGDSLAANANQYATINRYMGEDGLDGQFDFVLYHAVTNSVFSYGERGMLHLDAWTGFSQTEYTQGSVMTPYLGSHDTSRLVSTCDYRGQDSEHDRSIVWNKWPENVLPQPPSEDEPYDRASVALCWLLTIPGAPMIYMGDEYGEYGGGDPDNRHMFRQGEALNQREQTLLSKIRDIGSARQRLRPLRRGDYSSLGSTEAVMVFARSTMNDDVVVAINGSNDSSSVSVNLPNANANYAEVLNHGGSIAQDGAAATLTIPARSCAIYAH